MILEQQIHSAPLVLCKTLSPIINKLRGLSPGENYTDLATDACRRSQ
jgi:hypothetical protein